MTKDEMPDGITDSMEATLSEFRELVLDREESDMTERLN